MHYLGLLTPWIPHFSVIMDELVEGRCFGIKVKLRAAGITLYAKMHDYFWGRKVLTIVEGFFSVAESVPLRLNLSRKEWCSSAGVLDPQFKYKV